MKSHELLRKVFRKFGCKNVAQELRLSLSLVQKWTRPCGKAGSGELNPLDRIVSMLQYTGDRRLVEWLCREAGGQFTANPPLKEAHEATLIPASCDVMREMSNLQAAMAAGMKDCRMSPEQAAELRELWDVLKPDMERYLESCERGQFRPCKWRMAA
jgi:hypothetical protein